MAHALSQKGLTAIEALLIAVILAVIGGTGYYVHQANRKAVNTLNTASQASDSATTKPNKSVAKAVNLTANWTAYTNQAGKFSLKYPNTWIQAINPKLCTDSILLIGPDKEAVGTCGSENFAQISIISMAGDTQADNDISSDPGFKDIQQTTVLVDGVQGKRIQATAAADPGGEGDFSVQASLAGSYPVGATVVKYIFVSGDTTYVATYVQTPSGVGSKNVLPDFDLIVTKTLRFH